MLLMSVLSLLTSHNDYLILKMSWVKQTDHKTRQYALIFSMS